MTVYPAEVVHVSILAPPGRVFDFQKPPATSEQSEQDVRAVRDDFARIKTMLESNAGSATPLTSTLDR